MSAALSAQYQQQPTTTHSRDHYFSQQQPQSPPAQHVASSSPSATTRKPSRRQSANNGSSPETPQQQAQQFSPSGSSSVTTPRAQPAQSSSHTTPTASPAQPSNYPPRSSSHQRTTRTAQDPMAQQSERTRIDSATAQAPSSSQSRRRAQDGTTPDSPSTGSRPKQQHGPNHSRSATAVGSTPVGTNLSHEESTVINRLVITDPSEDIAREQARIAESRPGPIEHGVTPSAAQSQAATEAAVIEEATQRSAAAAAGNKSRQDHSASATGKVTRFGDYILGQTLGEGEFGKVKMGWKRDGGVQVAIKLIRREAINGNPNRLPKIYREIKILQGLQHPNIVRLHEMVETQRHIGIILEYASGGELFDYILNHRYLKDNAARRLFAQLISGVGYLHKKGIVHRDLKLENLLLDRNKNIIITDFGFANTFNANDELTDEIEYNLSNKDYVKSLGLDHVDQKHGWRRGDLMQTSCGSPCYAAPELVVSDSLYTGRKVDVWSCGVILYAMLAGYLPFDDDPANPEGDNINLLYKYIVSTPLTFPEYVTPHARDLLKRILVPDPRRRADLFEVARHSWLAEYAHLVGLITSTTTTEAEVKNVTIPSDAVDKSLLARSASVREPAKPHATSISAAPKPIQPAEDKSKTQRDSKRRTVQVEYVAPQQATAREQPQTAAATAATSPSTSTPRRTRADSSGPVEASPSAQADGYQQYPSQNRSQRQAAAVTSMPPPAARPTRESQRAASDSTAFGTIPPTSAARPSTGGALAANRLPSRGNSYGQPAAATVAQTNAQGRFAQPRGSKQYVISNPIPVQQEHPNDTMDSIGRPSIQGLPSNFQAPTQAPNHRGHKRANTIGERIFGKSGSIFGGRPSTEQSNQRPEKSYPPTSMKAPMDADAPRPSMESSRRTSFGFSRKNTDASSTNAPRTSRRFSLIPSSLTRGFSSHHHRDVPGTSYSNDSKTAGVNSTPRIGSRKQSRGGPAMAFGQGQSRSPSQSTQGSGMPGFYDAGNLPDRGKRVAPPTSSQGIQPAPAYPPQQGGFSENSLNNGYQNKEYSIDEPHPAERARSSHQPPHPHSQPHLQYTGGAGSSSAAAAQGQFQQPMYPDGFNSFETNKLHKPRRRFADAYEADNGHAGSSGPAKRVMDFFRKRGKARGGE